MFTFHGFVPDPAAVVWVWLLDSCSPNNPSTALSFITWSSPRPTAAYKYQLFHWDSVKSFVVETLLFTSLRLLCSEDLLLCLNINLCFNIWINDLLCHTCCAQMFGHLPVSLSAYYLNWTSWKIDYSTHAGTHTHTVGYFTAECYLL